MGWRGGLALAKSAHIYSKSLQPVNNSDTSFHAGDCLYFQNLCPPRMFHLIQELGEQTCLFHTLVLIFIQYIALYTLFFCFYLIFMNLCTYFSLTGLGLKKT